MRAPSSTAVTSPRDRMTMALACLPAAALVVLLALSWLGISLVAPAAAVTSDTGSVDVTGQVDKVVQLDPSSCTGAALVLGALTPGDPWKETTAHCTVSFGSNNSALGADLQVLEDASAGAGHAMKCVSICGTDSIADVPAGGIAPTSAATSAFGIRLDSAAGATAVWSTAGTAYPVADTADTACQTASTASGTCSFRFGARADAGTDQPGSYRALVQMVAQAR